MGTLLGIVFWLLVIWVVITLLRRRGRKPTWRDVAAAPSKPSTLSRPARAKPRCQHRKFEPVDVNGIVVANICLNPECGEALGPVVSRDPDGHVYFSEY